MLPTLLARLLRDFCHVEWWEVDELGKLVSTGNARFDTQLFKAELRAIVEGQSPIPILEINDLTGNEFQGQEEARDWLTAIQRVIRDLRASASGR